MNFCGHITGGTESSARLIDGVAFSETSLSSPAYHPVCPDHSRPGGMKRDRARGMGTGDWDGGVFRVYGAKHKPRTSVRRTLGKTTTNFCPDWFLLFVNGTRVQRKAFYSNARVRAKESIHTILHASRPKSDSADRL